MRGAFSVGGWSVGRGQPLAARSVGLARLGLRPSLSGRPWRFCFASALARLLVWCRAVSVVPSVPPCSPLPVWLPVGFSASLWLLSSLSLWLRCRQCSQSGQRLCACVPFVSPFPSRPQPFGAQVIGKADRQDLPQSSSAAQAEPARPTEPPTADHDRPTSRQRKTRPASSSLLPRSFVARCSLREPHASHSRCHSRPGSHGKSSSRSALLKMYKNCIQSAYNV